MSNLFTPLTIGNIELKNRIVVSPMCQYSAIDGLANDWHFVHYGSRAVGGAGLVLTEATAVSPEGRISSMDLGLWKDEQIIPMQRIVKFIDSQGSVAGVQLAHAGRKASHGDPGRGDAQLSPTDGGWLTVAPSTIPFKKGELVPVELNESGIKQVIADFKSAAERALIAGFKVIEIHAAHGYLLHQFLSPLSNKRTDSYGGTFENRIRLLLEVVQAVRLACPEGYPLIVRLSATDWTDGGWDIAETVKLSALLKEAGVHLIDCSTGGNVSNAHIPIGPGYQVSFAEQVRKGGGILSGAIGMITTGKQAEQILNEGKADLIVIGREFLRDPYFPLHAARDLGEDISYPQQYVRAK